MSTFAGRYSFPRKQSGTSATFAHGKIQRSSCKCTFQVQRVNCMGLNVLLTRPDQAVLVCMQLTLYSAGPGLAIGTARLGRPLIQSLLRALVDCTALDVKEEALPLKRRNIAKKDSVQQKSRVWSIRIPCCKLENKNHFWNDHCENKLPCAAAGFSLLHVNSPDDLKLNVVNPKFTLFFQKLREQIAESPVWQTV